MGRIFRAFLWMRWRVLVNSLERTGSRDTLERFSVATGKLGPDHDDDPAHPVERSRSSCSGIAAGFGIGDRIDDDADGGAPLPDAPRHRADASLGPIVLPTRDGGSVTRLLLLPIPRTALYMAQVAGALADPWIALMVRRRCSASRSAWRSA